MKGGDAMNIDPKLKILTQTALMAALIFVVTFAVRIPIPFASGGYLNIGDAPVYIAGFLLGGPAGALAAAIGSALSDILGGYPVYAVATFIIKGLMGYVCGRIAFGKGLPRFALASVTGGAIMVAGYAIFEALFFNVPQAIAAIPFNAVQWLAGVVVAVILYPVISKVFLPGTKD
jgi:uncharacterized membrane protein